MLIIKPNVGSGSLPTYLNSLNSAKEFSFEISTAIQGNFLDISKETEFLVVPTVIDNSETIIKDTIILDDEE